MPISKYYNYGGGLNVFRLPYGKNTALKNEELIHISHSASCQSKKISNDQELIQSDPTFCSQNQPVYILLIVRVCYRKSYCLEFSIV